MARSIAVARTSAAVATGVGTRKKKKLVVASSPSLETRIALAAEVDKKARLCACELGIPGSLFRASEGLASSTTLFRTLVRKAAATEPTTANRVAASALFLKRTRAVAAETVHLVALLIESRAAAWWRLWRWWSWWWSWWWWCRPKGPGAEVEAEAEEEGASRRRLAVVEAVVVVVVVERRVGIAARAFPLGAALTENREPLEARDRMRLALSVWRAGEEDEEEGERARCCFCPNRAFESSFIFP